jgi:hypothetical protein
MINYPIWNGLRVSHTGPPAGKSPRGLRSPSRSGIVDRCCARARTLGRLYNSGTSSLNRRFTAKKRMSPPCISGDQMSLVGSAISDWFTWDMHERCIVRELAKTKLDDPSNLEKRTACERIVMRRRSAVERTRPWTPAKRSLELCQRLSMIVRNANFSR